jgi:hypothetical protein
MSAIVLIALALGATLSLSIVPSTHMLISVGRTVPTDIYHFCFSLMVVSGCFVLIYTHRGNEASSSSIMALIIGHYFGRQAAKNSMCDYTLPDEKV